MHLMTWIQHRLKLSVILVILTQFEIDYSFIPSDETWFYVAGMPLLVFQHTRTAIIM